MRRTYTTAESVYTIKRIGYNDIVVAVNGATVPMHFETMHAARIYILKEIEKVQILQKRKKRKNV